MRNESYWLLVFNTVSPVFSSFISMSLQLRVVDNTLDWRGLSCLRVTLATIAGHRHVCTLWWCRRTMVRNFPLHLFHLSENSKVNIIFFFGSVCVCAL